jgi:hypothetical protein
VKSFFSCIDGGLSAPQPVQHLVIRDRVAKAGGAVTFYGAEDVQTLASQAFIRPKLARLKQQGLDGVVFYSLHQFRYGEQFNYALLLDILALDLEVLFACEGLSLRTRDELAEWFPFLTAIDFAKRRDQSPAWRKFIAEFDPSATASLP